MLVMHHGENLQVLSYRHALDLERGNLDGESYG
jgi:hypothetical protein